MRLRRGSPTKGLEFDLEIPEGLNVDRDIPGVELVVSAGEQQDPAVILDPSPEKFSGVNSRWPGALWGAGGGAAAAGASAGGP